MTSSKATKDISPSKVALQGLDAYNAWLRANPIKIKKDGKDTGKTTQRQSTASASVPPDLYVDLVQTASEVPGAMADGDLVDGALARVVRRAVFMYLRPDSDVDAWEAELEEARAENLRARGELLGANAKVTKGKLDLLAQLAASDPDIAAKLAALDASS